ncbi:hypothetical protein D7030_03735 [Flavobacteriaceae bacterium AU392]|nr:hypothetical protein D1817_10210 [Flavobacteriaceae bacterium]RKM85788.1 hypothetical protein D7030_03735 [Flavobacteriaceae bacterium AU392]
MRHVLFTIISLFFLSLSSCSNTDLTEISLDAFDQELGFCIGPNGNDFIVFDTTPDPFQSLILVIPNDTMNALIFNPTDQPTEGSLTINGTTTRLNYRTYNGNPDTVICQPVPSAVTIIDDFDSASGTINYSSTSSDSGNIRTVIITFSVSDIDLEVLRIAGEQSIGTLTLTLTI